MPEAVKAVPGSMFYGCNNLSNVKLTSDTKSIGGSAFYGCATIKNITIPSTVTSIGIYCFDGCSNLNDVVLPENITAINDYTFYGCSSLNNVSIPEKVTVIGSQSFSGTAIKEISMSDNITAIGSYAFSNCTSLKKFKFSTNEKMLIIPEGMFSGCTSLNDVVIPVNITTLNKNSFANCTSLTNLFVKGNGLVSITNPFEGASEDLVVKLNPTSQMISYCDKNNIKYVTIDDSKPYIERINTDLASPVQSGNKIQITTVADGQSELKYIYMILKDGVITSTSGKYSTDSIFEWTPNSAGNYQINCVVCDEDGNMTIKSINYVVTEKPADALKITALKTSLVSPQAVGQKIKLRAAAVGKGTLKYKFIVFKNGTEMVYSRKYKSSSYAYWTPTEKGSYLIVCKVTDSTGKEVRTSIRFNVK